MIAPAIATISASRSPSALPNCGDRTSLAARSVNSAIPIALGSTMTMRSRRLRVSRPSPTDAGLGHCRADHPQRLDRDRTIGMEIIRAVEIDGIDIVTRHELLQIDHL